MKPGLGEFRDTFIEFSKPGSSLNKPVFGKNKLSSLPDLQVKITCASVIKTLCDNIKFGCC
ncbi:MAG: hypothetical protein BWY45_02194 [Euryarchaeota archaeon ADurb.Bin294]|nr:MAG: hypothetical protein BWY45_02194 [Euryarchaeota archaeon ADurb.Bin294]